MEVRRYRSGRTAIRIDFTFKGVRCRETLPIEATAANLKYAQNLRAEIQARIARGQFVYTDYFPDSPRARIFGHQVCKQTVREALEEWLADAEKTKTYSTWKSYRTSARSWLIPHLGDLRLTDLEPRHIRDLIRAMPGKQKTVNNVLLPLRGILKRAKNDDVIRDNPMDRVEAAELLSPVQKRSEYEVDPFSAEEITALLEACHRLFGENARNLLQFHAYTGVRTGELFGLEWEQLSVDQVRIDRAVVHAKPALTKTSAGRRDIPLTPMAAEAIRRQKAITGLQGGRVFYAMGKEFWPYDYWRHYSDPFKRACQLAGVRYRNPYQMRHTFASQMLSGGEHPLRVSTWLGHEDATMVLKVYGKWIEQAREFISNWGQAAPLTPRAKGRGDVS